MTKERENSSTSKKRPISEGMIKKGSVNTRPTSSRPSRPAGQSRSNSKSGKKE